MKLLQKTLSVTLSALVVSTSLALPLSVNAETSNSTDTKTVFTLENGQKKTIYSTASAENSDGAESYEVLYKNKRVLKVASGAASKASGNYYSVTFTIPNTKKEVFLTGLTAENVDVVQQKLIANYSIEDEFSIESLDFIDAEKVYNAQDSNLCWAATCSNMLKYSGWAEQAGFNTEDDILEEYADNYSGRGNDIFEGIKWFFDGTDRLSEAKKGSGAYIPDYVVDDLYTYGNLENDFLKNAANMVADLKAGKAVGLSISWRSADGDYTSGSAHAVTLFGAIIDKDYTPDDYQYYNSLILADSDNSKNDYDSTMGISDRDRRSVSNTLTVAKLEPFYTKFSNNPLVKWKGYDAVLSEYTSLIPYSENIKSKKETDPNATKNKNTTVDFYPLDVNITNIENGVHTPTMYSSDFFVSFSFEDAAAHIENYPDSVNYKGDVKVVFKLKDAEGKTLQTQRKYVAVDTYNSHFFYDYFELKDIKPGKYTALITVNDDKAVTEAYFINNKMTKEFEVKENVYDFSGVSFNLNADKIAPKSSDSVEIACQFDGLNNCEAMKKIKNSLLYITYYENEKWSSPEQPSTTYKNYSGIGDLPETIMVQKRGTKVKCILYLNTDNGIYTITTGEHEMLYQNCVITTTKNNTDECSALPKNSNKLINSEKLAFTIKNDNVGSDDDLTGSYRLFSVYNGKFYFLSEPVKFTLKKGEETQEITFDSWSSDFKPESNVYINVGVNFPDGSSMGKQLTYLRIQEDKSTQVNTPLDIEDPCDNQISLREAVSYAAKTGTTVTVSDSFYQSFELHKPLDINGKVKIDLGGKEITPFVNSGMFESIHLFNISKGAEAEISNGKFQSSITKNDGGAFYIDGGSLTLNNCLVNYCFSDTKGGAVYANGGKLILKNSVIKYCSAPCGTAVFLDGGASAEILNTFIGCSFETKGVVYNRNGSLNIINSTIVPLYLDNYDKNPDGKKYYRAVISNKNTNIINSIVFSRNDSAVSGAVNIWSSAINGADPEVKTDSSVIICKLSEICTLSSSQCPQIYTLDNLHMTLYLSGKAKKGAKTSSQNNKIVLTDSSGKTTNTNISTVFTNQELSLDATGNTRTAIMGSTSKIFLYGTPLSDLTTDVFGIPAFTYNGKALTFKPEVYSNSTLLIEGTDYKITFKNNKNAGVASYTVKGIGEYRGSVSGNFKIAKAKNTLTAKAVEKSVKLSKLAKANQKVEKTITVSKNKGTVSYKKSSGSKYLSISSKGVVTVKKGKFKAGTVFKMKVIVTAKGTSNYKSGSKTVSVRIKAK